MRTFVVVVLEPRVQVLLQSCHRGVDLGAADFAEKFIQHRAVEPLHEAVGLWTSQLSFSVFDVVEIEVEFVLRRFHASFFSSTVIVTSSCLGRSLSVQVIHEHYSK